MGAIVGDTKSTDGGRLPLWLRTGLGLLPNFASSRLGREMGRGIRDLLPVNDPELFLPLHPRVVLVAALVVVDVPRLVFEELLPELQKHPSGL